MNEPTKKPNQINPGSYSPKTPKLADMMKNHMIEKFVKIITYKGVDFEVVDRLDLFWVGCVDYAKSNKDEESDIQATLARYKTLKHVEKRALVNPDWGGCISINYTTDDAPNGIFFGQETNSSEQDERYETLAVPGGLWLRVQNTSEIAMALFGTEKAWNFQYYGKLAEAAKENGYKRNPDIKMEIQYESSDIEYAYIPIMQG